MNETTEPAKQLRNSSTDHLKPWQFKPGQSGNPAGKPKGTLSLKEYARQYLKDMTDDEKKEFMRGIDKVDIWKLAEGNPKNDLDLNAKVTIADVLKEIEYGNNTQDANIGTVDTAKQITGQVVADVAVIQNPGQEEKSDNIPTQQSTAALPATQMVQEHYSESSTVGIYD